MMAEKSKSLLQKRKNKTILEEENKTQILVDLAVLEESNLQKKKKEKEKRKINNQEIDKKEEEIKENDQNTPTEENTRSKVEGIILYYIRFRSIYIYRLLFIKNI